MTNTEPDLFERVDHFFADNFTLESFGQFLDFLIQAPVTQSYKIQAQTDTEFQARKDTLIAFKQIEVGGPLSQEQLDLIDEQVFHEFFTAPLVATAATNVAMQPVADTGSEYFDMVGGIVKGHLKEKWEGSLQQAIAAKYSGDVSYFVNSAPNIDHDFIPPEEVFDPSNDLENPPDYNIQLDQSYQFPGELNIVYLSKIAVNIGISVEDLISKSGNEYLYDRELITENGDSVYLFFVGENLNITPPDLDTQYYLETGNSNALEQDNPTSISSQDYWGNLLIDLTGSTQTTSQALQDLPLADYVASIATITSGSNDEYYYGYGKGMNLEEAFTEMDITYDPQDIVNLLDSNNVPSGGYIKDGTEGTSSTGSTYALNDIAESLASAGNALGEFVNKAVGTDIEWFTDESVGSIQLDVANWLGSNLGNLIDGSITAEQAFIDLAEYVAQNRITGYVIGTIATQTDARNVLAQLYTDAGAGGDALILSDATFSALAQMAVQFTLSSQGWDSEQYTKAGISIISSTLAYEYAQSYFGEASGIGPSGAAAAAATIVNGLLDSSDYTNGDWAMLGVQTGIATGSAVAGTAIAEAIFSAAATTANPAVMAAAAVIAAVIAITGGKIVESLYQGKVYYEGEFGDLGGLLNTIYQVQQVDDGNGNMVDALIATNSEGSTILAQGITHIIGNSGQDVLVGNDNLDDVISGNDGSDYIEGQSGNDTLMGGQGNDHITGGIGNDIIQGGLGNDVLFGDEGEDTIIANEGNDFIHGGSGNDIIDSGVGNDTILGGGGDDSIATQAGEDMIDGGAGDDVIDSGDDDDIVIGNHGNDLISLGNGDDIAFGAEDNDTIIAGAGYDIIDGGAGSDILQGENGNDLINGGSGNDFLDGGLGNDDLLGGSGDDSLLGGMDNDFLYGEDGNDELYGSFGDDILDGGTGADILDGGQGDDLYSFGEDVADENNIITDESGENDAIILKWLTEANAISGLALNQIGDDLIVKNGDRIITTISDHFNGMQIERIEIANGKKIDLSSLTIDTNGSASFTISPGGGAVLANAIDYQIDSVETKFQIKEKFWNSGFVQNLSEIAYEEQLKEEVINEYYNGSEIISYYRNRSQWGGKYTLYKLVVNETIEGDPDVEGYTILEPEEIAGAGSIYDEVVSGEEITTEFYLSDNSFGTIKYLVTDVWVEGEHAYSTVKMYALGGYPQPTWELQDENDIDSANGSEFYGFAYKDGQWMHNNPATTAQTRNDSNLGSVAQITVGLDIIGPTNQIDKFIGTSIGEQIIGNSGNDVLIGNSGDDNIDGGLGEDWMFGGDDQDVVDGGNNNDSIFGGSGNDILYGGQNKDTILGGAGDDTIYGEDGSDWIDGGQGVDQIEGGQGDDIIFAGDDDDIVSGNNGIDIIYGQNGDDTIYGGLGDDMLYGRLDDDTIYGEEGNDTINGNQGQDQIFGGAGDDILRGGLDNDTIYSGQGNNLVDGGQGVDLLTYELSGDSIAIDLDMNSSTIGSSLYTDSVTNIENVTGSDFDDSIKGSSLDNALEGRAGDDLIIGRAGNDTLSGGQGIDTIYGGTGEDDISGDEGDDILYGWKGSDVIDGGAGNDTLYGEEDDDLIYSGQGNNTIDGGQGIDLLTYELSGDSITIDLDTNSSTVGSSLYTDSVTNIENVTGSETDDSIKGNSLDNVLEGRAGDDLIIGRAGNDTLSGGQGIDTIYGGTGKMIFLEMKAMIFFTAGKVMM
jgi:Ca2+-binding RTX toxin-like protein